MYGTQKKKSGCFMMTVILVEYHKLKMLKFQGLHRVFDFF